MRSKFLQLAFILTLAACALGQQPAPRNDAATTVERLRAHVTYLASDKLAGRRTGTEGANLAAAYIAAEFERLGLRSPGRVTQVNRSEARSLAKYEQQFPYVAGVELGKDNLLSFRQKGGASALDLRVGEDWMPLGSSPSARVTEAPLAFVGYGLTASELNYDDYATSDVKGRAAVAFEGTPDGDNPHGQFARYADVRWKAIAARDHGAQALVVIAREENFRDEPLGRLSYDNSAGDAGLPVIVVSRQAAGQLLDVGGSKQVTAMEDWVRKFSVAQQTPLKANDTSMYDVKVKYVPPKGVLTIRTDVVRRETPGRNVIGVLEGSDPKLKGEAIIIGAHYDHLGLGGEGSLAPRAGEVHHGADDNASGTAGLIELASAFTRERRRPARTLIFIAFSGEEEGLIGSNFYVNHPVWPLNQTIAMINMDMIGRMKEDKLIVGGVGTARQWREWVEQVNMGEGKLSSLECCVVQFAGEQLSLTLNEDGYGPSDHSSFYAKQIPVLFFWTGTHADYHKPSDTADKINYEDEARILSLVASLVRSIDRSAARPTYTVAKSESAGRSMGFRVYLGTIPNYAESGEGLRLDGVREDSPAAAAGLKAGDLVVRLAGRDVRNVYDYTYALGEMKAGQEYEVEVLRGTEHLKLKIIPAARK
jgi:hypothetical protein